MPKLVVEGKLDPDVRGFELVPACEVEQRLVLRVDGQEWAVVGSERGVILTVPGKTSGLVLWGK